ncbi:hypothetical protein HDV03_001993 [Kappamyces sp. JEL0829]|nr:hypothetical protein HDV03_001993 [Kappamyces sp. JEL0829]
MSSVVLAFPAVLPSSPERVAWVGCLQLLLEITTRCIPLKKHYYNDHALLKKVVECLGQLQDVTSQILSIQFLYRCTPTSEEAKQSFVKSTGLSQSFLAIRRENFHQTCRDWLWEFNSKQSARFPKLIRSKYVRVSLGGGRFESLHSDCWVDINHDGIFVQKDANGADVDFEFSNMMRWRILDKQGLVNLEIQGVPEWTERTGWISVSLLLGNEDYAVISRILEAKQITFMPSKTSIAHTKVPVAAETLSGDLHDRFQNENWAADLKESASRQNVDSPTGSSATASLHTRSTLSAESSSGGPQTAVRLASNGMGSGTDGKSSSPIFEGIPNLKLAVLDTAVPQTATDGQADTEDRSSLPPAAQPRLSKLSGVSTGPAATAVDRESPTKGSSGISVLHGDIFESEQQDANAAAKHKPRVTEEEESVSKMVFKRPEQHAKVAFSSPIRPNRPAKKQHKIGAATSQADAKFASELLSSLVRSPSTLPVIVKNKPTKKKAAAKPAATKRKASAPVESSQSSPSESEYSFEANKENIPPQRTGGNKRARKDSPGAAEAAPPTKKLSRPKRGIAKRHPAGRKPLEETKTPDSAAMDSAEGYHASSPSQRRSSRKAALPLTTEPAIVSKQPKAAKPRPTADGAAAKKTPVSTKTISVASARPSLRPSAVSELARHGLSDRIDVPALDVLASSSRIRTTQILKQYAPLAQVETARSSRTIPQVAASVLGSKIASPASHLLPAVLPLSPPKFQTPSPVSDWSPEVRDDHAGSDSSTLDTIAAGLGQVFKTHITRTRATVHENAAALRPIEFYREVRHLVQEKSSIEKHIETVRYYPADSTQALLCMYGGNATSLQVKEAESLLLAYQKTFLNWPQSVKFLMGPTHPNIQFFAAQSLETGTFVSTKPARNLFEKSERLEAAANLMRWLHGQNGNPPAFIATKVILALAVFAIKYLEQDPLSIQNFCSETMQVLSGRDASFRSYYLKLIVQFLAFIPEEAEKMTFVFSDGKTAKFKVGELCSFALENVLPLLDDPDTAVQAAALVCIASWATHSTIDSPSFFPLFEKTIQKLPNTAMIETTSDVLITLLGDSRIIGLEKTVANSIYPTLLEMSSHLMQAIQEEDEDFVSPFCKLLCKFAEVFIGFLMQSLPATAPFFDMLLACTAYSALYPSNPDISEIPHYFWFNFESELETTNDLKPNQLSPETIKHGRDILFRVLFVMVEHCTYPSDAVVSGWTSDVLDRFKIHRRECGDTSLYCYYALEDQALAQIATGLSAEIQQLSHDPQLGLQKLEALLFHAKAFAESIAADEGVYTPMIFHESSLDLFQNLATSTRNGARILRLTVASMMGSFAEWLAVHPESLPKCVNFLVSELSASPNPSVAASSLVELCSICQVPLSKHCDEIMNLCLSILPQCSASVKGRVFQSMSYIVKALPQDEAGPRLSFLIGGIIDQVSQDLAIIRNAGGTTPATREALLMHLEFIKSFCKGGRVDVDQLDGLSPEDASLGARFLEMSESVLGFFVHDEPILQEMSLVLGDCAKAHFHFFQPHAAQLLRLTANAFLATRHAFLITSCTLLFRSIDFHSASTVVSKAAADVCCVFAEHFTSLTAMETSPDVVHEFFEFLWEVLHTQMSVVEHFPQDLVEAIFGTGIINGLQVQEFLAFNAVLKFVHGIVGLGMASTTPTIVTRILDLVCKPVLECFLKSIAGAHSSSLLPKISKAMLELIAALPNVCQAHLVQLLQPGMCQALTIAQDQKTQGIPGSLQTVFQ